MNCKPGDLALVVKSKCGNEGKIVYVVRPATEEEYDSFVHKKEGHHWWVEAKGALIFSTAGHGRRETCLPDARLRPIRDPGEDARDETLTWLPVPAQRTKETA